MVEWTAGDVERLARLVTDPTGVPARAVSVPHPRVAAVIDLLAEEPNSWISIAAVSERSGETQSQVRGLLARLTRVVRTNLERDNWPFVVEGRSSEPDGDWIAHYRMIVDIADWWKAARQGRGTAVGNIAEHDRRASV